MKKEKMKPIMIKFSHTMYADIKARSVQTERSVSQYIRDILALNKHPFVVEEEQEDEK